MKKKGAVLLVSVLAVVLVFGILSFSFVSASWFSDVFGKLFGNSGVTGNVIADTTNLVPVNWTNIGSGNGFTIKASADLNNDGRDEVILQNALGNIGYWTLNASGYPIAWKVINESVYASNGSAASWYTFKLIAAGKINNQNVLFFQDLTMRVAYWTLNSDAKPILWTDLGLVQPAWTVGAVAGNNSVSKVFIESEKGEVGYWNMNSSGSPVAWNTISNAGTFKIMAAADINKDGMKDVFFEDDAGRVAYWLMNADGLPASWKVINTSAIPGWIVGAAAGDSNNTFIFLQKVSDGTVGYWTMGAKTSSIIPPQIATCTDSDGGLNYSVKGSVTASNFEGLKTDNCPPYIDGLAHLNEYYCNGTVGEVKDYVCSNGCSAGACVNSTTPTCTDSDEGLNYYVKGTTTICSPELGCSEFTDDDWCEPSNPSLLNERICFSNNISQTLSYNCPNGCVNGSCIAGPVTIGNCTDSDGGLNYYVFGNVTTTGLGTSYDICVPSITGGLPNSIEEYYCNASDSNAFYYNIFDCPYGCLNGSCLANPINPIIPDTTCSEDNKCSDYSSGELRCFAIGYRLSSTANPTYCGNGLQFLNQKNDNSTCTQHYECKSNYCGGGHCIDLMGQQQYQTGLLSKILCYLRKFFLNSQETC